MFNLNPLKSVLIYYLNILGIGSLLVSSYLRRSKKYKIGPICIFSAKCFALAIPITCQTFHENGNTVHISAVLGICSFIGSVEMFYPLYDIFIVTVAMLCDWWHQCINKMCRYMYIKKYLYLHSSSL